MHRQSRPISGRPRRGPGQRRLGLLLVAALSALLAVALAPRVEAQDQDCSEPGMNGQCSEFGAIAMASQVDIRGERVPVRVAIVLSTTYEDQAARWLLFSVRSLESDGSPTPVSIGLAGFATANGDIVTTRVEQPAPGELNLWVDTLDAPVGSPISLDLIVGSSERGAYRLETLVMAFDRGYAPVQDSEGKDASLYSFTTLGVNGETAAAPSSDESSLRDRLAPGPGVAPALGAVAAALAAALLARRR